MRGNRFSASAAVSFAIVLLQALTGLSCRAGTGLGSFSILSEGTTQGNSMTLAYGQALEGGSLITYWPGSANMSVVSMGSSRYELVDSQGGRCLTASGSAVTVTTCTGIASQLFELNLQPDGSYTIESNSGSCIDAPGSFTYVDALTCTPSSLNQRWNFNGSQPLSLTGGTTPITYALIVNNGTGTGSYTAGAVISVVANAAPAGYQFSGWTGPAGTLANPNSFSTSLIMPSGATIITATYSVIPVTNTLTVNSGSGSGSYIAGTAITIAANGAPTGYQFSGWTGATSALANPSASATTLIMPGATTQVTATYVQSSGGPANGASLGSYALLNEAATLGNSMVDNYGQSIEGGSLTTYWQFGTAVMNVISMGNSQYEILENTGGRCLTAVRTTVTIATCTGSVSQLFALTQQSDNSYSIQSGVGNCIEAAGAFSPVGAQPCSSTLTQHWIFSGSIPLSLTGNSTVVHSGTSSTVPAGYHLTFDDEFPSLSISDVRGAGTNWYSKTIQCCLVDTSSPSTPTYMAGMTSPVSEEPFSLVPGGGLDIRLQKTNGAWYSGVIASVDSAGNGFSQQYGYFELKANFPSGFGTWPAFWLLNTAALTSGAYAGEIDLVESYMLAPTAVNTTLHDWTPPATTIAYHQAQVANLSAGFHIFGMLWTPSTLTFYCDGAVIYETPTPSIMNQPYYMIIDLGLGGGFPTNQTPSQSDMLIQYVRVYSQ